MDMKNQRRIKEQRDRRLMGIGGEVNYLDDQAKFVGTEAWFQALRPVEEIIIKRAKLPEGAFGNPLKSPDQIESTTEPGLHGER